MSRNESKFNSSFSGLKLVYYLAAATLLSLVFYLQINITLDITPLTALSGYQKKLKPFYSKYDLQQVRLIQMFQMDHNTIKSENYTLALKANSTRKIESKRKKETSVKSIAIACAVTSKNMNASQKIHPTKYHHLFKYFLPSFCKTASQHYEYSFYIR